MPFHKSAHKACPTGYRPRPEDILRHMPTATLHPSRTFARSRQWPRVHTLRGGDIASSMGMDFEQASKVRQGHLGWQGIAIVQGHFFPVYGKALHGVDGSAHVKDKGLPWLRAKGRIQHNPTLALSILRLGPDSQSGHARVRRQGQRSQ